jgi:hypothetical protein
MGTRETNVSEEETAAARRDGKPPTSAEQQRRQGVTTAAEHSTAGELPDPAHEGATIMDTPQTASPDPGDGAKAGGYRHNTAGTFRAGTPASQASRGGSTSRNRCSRRQLTQLLKEGSECFDSRPDPQNSPGGQSRPRGIAKCHLHAGRRHSAVHACLPGRRR